MADLAVVRGSLPETDPRKEEAMKKLLITAAVAAIAAVPGVTGLVGNASFAQSVPVQVPAGASTLDDHGRHTEPGDDRGQHAEPGDDRGQHAEPGDDRGQHAEPGDDRGQHAEPGDDRVGASGPGAATTTRGPVDGQAAGLLTADDGGSGHSGHDDGSADR
jgi:hypothetical protein